MFAASGQVFEDCDGNGRRGAGQRGIAGVMVSNGRDVVLTGSDGGWRLPVAEGESVFVIKPAHWATRTGKGGVPQFSHRCGGTAGQACLSDPLDFALTRREEPSRFDVLMFADTQPANDIELGYLRDDIVASTLGSTAAFGINHGDVVFDNHALYPRYLEIMGATGIPWHHCPGNHDIDPGARDDAASRDTWQRVFGARHYAFQYAGTTFIVLDNVFYFGHSGSYCGWIGERQLQFVRNVLAHVPREQLVVVSMHIPLETYQDPANPGDNTADRDALLRLLQARPHAVSFAGHMHLTEHHYLAWKGADGTCAPHHHHVLTAASGAWWGGPLDSRGIPSADSADGNPNGYHLLSVNGSDCLSRFMPSAAKSGDPLRVVVDGPALRRGPSYHAGTGNAGAEPIAASDLPGCDLVVNVFDGGPRTTVSCEIAGRPGAPITLQRAQIPDPYVLRLFARSASVQKPWVQALPSSHVWRAPLPADLGQGVHRITVRAIDDHGRLAVAQRLVEVGAGGPGVTKA